MWWFLLLFAGMVGFIFLLYKFIMVYSVGLLNFFVGDKQQDIDFIVSNKTAPPTWKKKLDFYGKLGPAWAKRYALRRLCRAIHYIEHTPLVDDEDSRTRLTAKLRQVKTEWKSMSMDEIFPYKDSGYINPWYY